MRTISLRYLFIWWPCSISQWCIPKYLNQIYNLLLLVTEYNWVNSFLLILVSFTCTLVTLNKIWFDLIWFVITSSKNVHWLHTLPALKCITWALWQVSKVISYCSCSFSSLMMLCFYNIFEKSSLVTHITSATMYYFSVMRGFKRDSVWNIQCRWSLYVRILCGLLLCDSSLIYRKCWPCLCIPLYSWWRFRTPNGLWDFFTP